MKKQGWTRETERLYNVAMDPNAQDEAKMTPEAHADFCEEYAEGSLPDDMLAAKWAMTPAVFAETVRIGWGDLLAPSPLKRKGSGNPLNSAKVRQVAKVGQLMPEDMALSPVDANAMLTPQQRLASYALVEAELEFCNDILRGKDTVRAAAGCFGIFDRMEANRKASQLMREPRIRDYLAEMKNQRLFAPVRGRAYLEAILNQVIDRSLDLTQVYDFMGKPVEGTCGYNYKALIAASALLMKLKGWDNSNAIDTTTESHVDRLRRIAMAKQVGDAE